MGDILEHLCREPRTKKSCDCGRRFIRTFHAILEKRGYLLEDRILLFEHPWPLLAHRLTLLEEPGFIRTFQVLLEQVGDLLEHFPQAPSPILKSAATIQRPGHLK